MSSICISFRSMVYLLAYAMMGIGLSQGARGEDDSDPHPRYSLDLGFAKPSFPRIVYYEDLYGGTAIMPELSASYDFWRVPWVAVHGGLGVSYYNDKGHEAKYSSDPNAPIDTSEGELSLSFIPYLFFVGAQLNPFGSSFFAVSSWLGYEELMFREIRVTPTSSGTPTTTATTAPTSTTTTTSTSGDEGSFTNLGWNSALVFGVGLQFNVTTIEEANALSMARTTDFSQIYVSPYFEVTSSLGHKATLLTRKTTSPVNFERKAIGIAFTFSSAR